MIQKIWKKDRLNSGKIWKIWKKGKLNSEKMWKIWKKGRLNRVTIYSHMFMCFKKHTCFLLQSLFSALAAVWSVNSHGSNDTLP
jgi:hypothetical protein